jgi:hypothetical protein
MFLMPIVVPCEHCGCRLKAPDHLAGKRVKCRCGAVVYVPDGAPSPPDLTPAPAPSTPAPPQHRESRFFIFDWAPDGIRESLPAAVRVMLISVIIAAPFLVGGLYLLQTSLHSLEDIAPGIGTNALFSRAPMLLAGALGAAFGFISSKKVTSSSGLVGWPAFVVGSLGAILFISIGSLGGVFLSPDQPGPLFSYCLFCVALMSALGICFNAFWAA